MIPEKMLELLILIQISKDYNDDPYYSKYLDANYNVTKLGDRYRELQSEFLTKYALNKTEKSE